MAFAFPLDSAGKAGAIRINSDAASFHIPVVVYTSDGVTPITTTNRLPVDALPAGSGVLKGATQNVTTAGTRVQLPSFACREVTIIARRTNKGYIYVGGSDVSGTVYGVELASKESITLTVSNANLIYLDTSSSGDGVSYFAL